MILFDGLETLNIKIAKERLCQLSEIVLMAIGKPLGGQGRGESTMSGAKWVSQFLRFGYFPTIAVGVNGLAIAAIFSNQEPTTVAIQILACMAFALAFSFAPNASSPTTASGMIRMATSREI
jgi:hypothetical protein